MMEGLSSLIRPGGALAKKVKDQALKAELARQKSLAKQYRYLGRRAKKPDVEDALRKARKQHMQLALAAGGGVATARLLGSQGSPLPKTYIQTSREET